MHREPKKEPGGMTASTTLSEKQLPGVTWDELDAHLEREFHPAQLDAVTVTHPRSGYQVRTGLERRVSRPPDGQDWGPAEFTVTRHPGVTDHILFPEHVGTEPIRHVYRAMSSEEWHEARQRGFIQSDQRGTIADWEGTNAAVDPHSAGSYLPYGHRGHIAKIRVEPSERWFTHAADSYIRTRERVPLKRVEHVLDVDKDLSGRLRLPGRQAELEGAE
jgi:hypothetical protein